MQGVAAREAAPFCRVVAVIAQVQAESDQLILFDGVGDAGELRDGGAAQGGGAVERRMEGSDLLRGHWSHEFRGKVQRLVAEVEAQPFAVGLVDLNVLSQQVEELLGFIHHARELVEGNTHTAAV